MNTFLSPWRASPELQRKEEDFPASLDKLRELIEDKVHSLQSPFTQEQQGLLCEEDTVRGGLWRFAELSEELTYNLLQLQRQTEQELSGIHTQLLQIKERQQQLTAELQVSLTERPVQSERLLFQEHALSALSNLLTQDLLRYQEETHRLTSLTQRILSQSHREGRFIRRQSERSMQGKNQTEQQGNNMHALKSSFLSKSTLSLHSITNPDEAEQARRASFKKPIGLYRGGSNLQRAGSVKNLIGKFSGPDQASSFGSLQNLSPGTEGSPKSDSPGVPPESSLSKSSLSKPSNPGQEDSPVPSITITPPLRQTSQNEAETAAQSIPKSSQIKARMDCPVESSIEGTTSEPKIKTQSTYSGSDSVADSGMGSESELDSNNKQPDSPASEDEPITPKARTASHNPKYQLYLNNDIKTNGVSGGGSSSSSPSDANGSAGARSVGENGPKLPRFEPTRQGLNHHKGSLESLPRDMDDKVNLGESPTKAFNSPYSTSMDYNPMYRMSEFKGPGGMPSTNSEMNMYSFNQRSSSPVVTTPTLNSPRARFSAYDSLLKRRTDFNTPAHTPLQHQIQQPIQNHQQGMNQHYSLRSATMAAPNRKDYIQELTKQLETCQKRNQFLEAESVQMDKERNQIRFEMRALLVNNEDLLRDNTQLNNELKRMREQILDMQKGNQALVDKYRNMEIEVKEARAVMVEANNQEYAFNFLQQSLQNQIQDAEDGLEKQVKHSQDLSEKLWETERQLEDLKLMKGSKDKKTSELNEIILRLETELAEALLASTQAVADMNLHQKLRQDSQLRVEELDETLLEKEQELQRLQTLVNRLQGEVSGKLIDKERDLEDEIQQKERMQLQVKQAERTLEDLRMELQTTNQAKDDLAKQFKLAQEKLIDLESDLEELQDSENRWAAKHKRAIESTEQMQLKLIQEKDLNDQLETDKLAMERQLRDLRLEVEELQSSRVQEDVMSRAEIKVKELENALMAEERNKSVLTNTITKMERKINELSDQMEEENRIANEQKDLMTQRMRSLKRQLNEAEEETSRKDAQYRSTQRELGEERENNSRLQRQLLDTQLQTKRMDTLTIRQTLDNLRLDLSVDDEDEDGEQQQPPPPAPEKVALSPTVTKV